VLVNIPGYEIKSVYIRRFDDADKPSEKGIYQIEIDTGGSTTRLTFLGTEAIKSFVHSMAWQVEKL
jgi:hypothetical protein